MIASNPFGITSNKEMSNDTQKLIDKLNNKSYVKEENTKDNLPIESDKSFLCILNKIYNEINEIKVILNGLENKK